MIRFRINELLTECNEGRESADKLHMQSIADALGVPRSTLAGLTTGNREATTNTAYLEGLVRFFHLHHPAFEPSMLLEFRPPLGETPLLRIDDLYPMRAAKGGR